MGELAKAYGEEDLDDPNACAWWHGIDWALLQVERAFADGQLTPSQVHVLALSLDAPTDVLRAAHARAKARPKTIVRRLTCGHDSEIPNDWLATGHEKYRCLTCGEDAWEAR